ncbi:MAG: hypothetical protein SFY68_02020 [Candidatus Sumerlaeia bacterium]|nr:hypothetical protein [Candidatus Sumerlaeia bacterium]
MFISKINENEGTPFHTVVLNDKDLRILVRIAAILLRDYLHSGGWTCELTKTEGSLTLRSGNVVIKLFMDHDGKLGSLLLGPASANLSNAILGVDLTHLDPVHREAIRDFMKRSFGSAYSDPRANASLAKVWLQPIKNYNYDVAWFSRDLCEAKITEAEVDELLSRLASDRASIHHGSNNPLAITPSLPSDPLR